MKHCSLNSNFNHSKDKDEFLDTPGYTDQHQKLKATFYEKSTDSQNYLHANSKQPYSLKKTFFMARPSE